MCKTENQGKLKMGNVYLCACVCDWVWTKFKIEDGKQDQFCGSAVDDDFSAFSDSDRNNI